MPNGWRTIKSLVHKIRPHGRRGKGMAESFSKVDEKSCVTPAGTSNELDVQNEWEENTNTWSHIYSKSMGQPGKVANPARGQLNKENECFIYPWPRCSCVKIWSRETGSAVRSRVSLFISILRLNLVLNYLRGSSRVPRRHIYII